MKEMILDNIRKIKINRSQLPLRNYQALNSLRKGIFLLAKNIRKCELDLGKSDSVPMECIFHWFSVSSVNLLRLIGLIEIMNLKSWSSKDIKTNRKIIKDHCREYVKEIVPEVLKWRNKVSAHFAITDPRNEDNMATLEFSVMPQISYRKPYWYVGAYQFGTKKQISNISNWALTEEFEKIAKRCFPSCKLEKIKNA